MKASTDFNDLGILVEKSQFLLYRTVVYRGRAPIQQVLPAFGWHSELQLLSWKPEERKDHWKCFPAKCRMRGNPVTSGQGQDRANRVVMPCPCQRMSMKELLQKKKVTMRAVQLGLTEQLSASQIPDTVS